MRIVSATGDQVDRDAAGKVAPELEERDGNALSVLKTKSETADLIVVGSRGLQGLKTLGQRQRAHRSSGELLSARRSRRAAQLIGPEK